MFMLDNIAPYYKNAWMVITPSVLEYKILEGLKFVLKYKAS